MSSIDERIVSIKFNNSQFEAGIRTTVSSLDGLKKSLNFSAGISALGDLDAAGKKVSGPKIDTAGFDSSVKATVDSVNDLKKNLKFDGVSKGLSDLDAAGKKVNLKLDAAGFQAGAKAVVDAATVIKQNLNFESVQRGFGHLKTSAQNLTFEQVITGAKNAARGLADLDLAGKAVSFLPISDGAEKANTSISALSIAGIAALGALAFKAVAVGSEMAQSLLIDPAKSGLAEYETNLNSIQTILANTQHQGTNLNDVNGALDELNTYSDKTIYNFAEMAKNIGTFTSAGVDLKTSTGAIKGIANLAALSGSNSQQASTAMYQMSQALSTGKVSLMDWNSVVNAGMGGKVFQDAIIETARNQGVAVDGFIAKNGSFRDSLQEGWLTSSVLTETLSKFTGDLTADQLKAMGYNDDQIAANLKMATTASDAATKIKTFSQLTGALAEGTASGWSMTWKLILGDFEQAKEMWTNVYDTLSGISQASADSRNKLLSDWNALGGRTEMIGAVSAAFKVLMGILNPIKEAFREVFPPSTGQKLFEITKFIRIFIEALIPGQVATSLLKNTFKLLFTIIKLGVDIIKGALFVIYSFFKAFATGGESVAGSTKPILDFFKKVADALANSTLIKDFFDGMARGAAALGTAFGKVVPVIGMLIAAIGQIVYDISGYAMYYVSAFARLLGGALVRGIVTAVGFIGELAETIGIAVKAFAEGGLDLMLTRVRERLESLSRLGGVISRAWDAIGNAVARAWERMLPVREAISAMFEDIKNEIKNALGDVNFNDTLDIVNTGLLGGLFFLFKGFFKKLTGMGDGVKDGLMKHISTSFEGVNGALEQLTSTLGAMQQNLQADTLLKIAIAIGVLAISVVVLSMIDSGKLTKALVAIGIMVVILGKAMGMLDKISVGSGFLKIPFIAASMILLAIALTILTVPVLILSRLSWGELLKGLAGVGVLLFFISKATESLAKNPANLIATGIGLMAVAIAIKILASAVADLSELGFGQMIQGLIGVGVLLTALSIFNNMTKVSKGSMASAIGLIFLGAALKIMASALSDFAAMDLGQLIQGLGTMAVVLLLLANFTKNVAPEGIFKAAAAMVILGIAMKVMASALGDFARMSWEEIAKGLLVMVVALTAMSKAMARVPPNMLTSAIGFVVVAAALKILASVLKDMGSMSWEEIAKGLTVLSVSLVVLSAAMILMQGTLAGAAAMLIAAGALYILGQALTILGGLSWEQIGMGMAALAAVFVLFGLAGLILAPLIPVLILLGVAIGLLGLGLMAMGVGVALFAAGLFLISAVLIATGPAIVLFVGSILALIPLAMAELGKGIVAFADVIGNAMPVFLIAFVKLLRMLLQGIAIVFPELMSTLWMIIVGLVDLIVRGVPLFVDAGMKILIGILRGIGDNMGQLVDAAVKVITEFIDGISRGLPQITESGTNLIITFVESLAASVRNNSDRMATAGADLAGAIIDGMANGVTQMAGRVLGAIGRVGENALAEMGRVLGINSPSREFALLGGFASLGMAVGITAKGAAVTRATGAVGNAALEVMKKTMSKISSVVPDDMTVSPVIRPVLDLSAIKKDSSLISDLMPTAGLSVEASYAKALNIAEIDRANKETDAELTTVMEADSARSIELVQNNYSPKALSAIEIYRQTKNLVSATKGV